MQARTMGAEVFAADSATIRKYSGWVTFASVASMSLGVVGIAYATTETVLSVFLFGCLLTLAGLAQAVYAFQTRTWSGFLLCLLDGTFRATAGAIMVVHPGVGPVTLPIVLSLYFIVGGAFKTIASIALQFPSWGWSVLSGLVAVILGVILVMQWPASSLEFIGLTVCLDLVLHGLALLMFAAALKRL